MDKQTHNHSDATQNAGQATEGAKSLHADTNMGKVGDSSANHAWSQMQSAGHAGADRPTGTQSSDQSLHSAGGSIDFAAHGDIYGGRGSDSTSAGGAKAGAGPRGSEAAGGDHRGVGSSQDELKAAGASSGDGRGGAAVASLDGSSDPNGGGNNGADRRLSPSANADVAGGPPPAGEAGAGTGGHDASRHGKAGGASELGGANGPTDAGHHGVAGGAHGPSELGGVNAAPNLGDRGGAGAPPPPGDGGGAGAPPPSGDRGASDGGSDRNAGGGAPDWARPPQLEMPTAQDVASGPTENLQAMAKENKDRLRDYVDARGENIPQVAVSGTSETNGKLLSGKNPGGGEIWIAGQNPDRRGMGADQFVGDLSTSMQTSMGFAEKNGKGSGGSPGPVLVYDPSNQPEAWSKTPNFNRGDTFSGTSPTDVADYGKLDLKQGQLLGSVSREQLDGMKQQFAPLHEALDAKKGEINSAPGGPDQAKLKDLAARAQAVNEINRAYEVRAVLDVVANSRNEF